VINKAALYYTYHTIVNASMVINGYHGTIFDNSAMCVACTTPNCQNSHMGGFRHFRGPFWFWAVLVISRVICIC